MKLRIFYIFVFVLFALSAHSQYVEERELDSLIRIYHSIGEDDSSRISVCLQIAHNHYNVDSTRMWSLRLLDLSKKHHRADAEANAYSYLSWVSYYEGNYNKANEFDFKTLEIADSIGDMILKADALHSIGDNFSYMGDYARADSYLYRAMDMFLALKDSTRYANTLYGLTDNLIVQKLFTEADSLLKIGIAIDSAIGYNRGLGFLYENMAVLYNTMYLYNYSQNDISLIQKSKQYALKSFEKLPQDGVRSLSFASKAVFIEAQNFGYTGQRLQQAVDSLNNFTQQLYDMVNRLDWEPERSYADLSKAQYLILMNKLDEAKIFMDSISDAADRNTSSDISAYINIIYEHYYMAIGDYKSAKLYLSKYFENVNSSQSLDYAVYTAQNLAESEYNNKIRQREESEYKKHLVRIYVSIGLLLLFAFILWEYWRKRKYVRELNTKNVMLQTQKEEILQQKEEINAQKDEIVNQRDALERTNQQITSSISYASLIQKAAMPRHEDVKKLFRDYFLIYRPLNIVAGDFYWTSSIGNFNIMVCADCTGHGVPGAFVSMLGISLLNEVTSTMVPAGATAAEVLTELRAKLMKSLGQNRSKYDHSSVYSMDGMDLAMVMIDYGKMTMQFAGAYRPLWIWRNGQIIQYKPDKMPIGVYVGPDKSFTNHDIQIMEGDMLYMFSDGIPDQFGYIDNTFTTCKHFSTKRLLALLTEIGSQSTDCQRERIEAEVDRWKNGYKQLDDNIMVGIRI
ncbi:MAG: SpoIIE family protein phosphatase [Bacteroidales bacterium]|nr:SpoIIE family protein phosphatase [Bacteroidales bacterium]